MAGRKWRMRAIGLVATAGALWSATTVYAQPAAAPAPVAAAPAPAAEPRPALWLLADEDTRIYLFGTFHILPQGFRWRSPAVEAAAAAADELVLEVSDRATMQDPSAMAGAMMLGKWAPVLWRVSPDRRAALREMIEGTGLPVQTFDGFHTWAVFLSLSVAQIARDYGGEDGQPADLADMPGVEDQLIVDFERRQRPIGGVETVREQMGFFQSMSFAEQRALLEAMIDDYRAGGHGAAPMGEADWARGDVDIIAAEGARLPPALYDVLLRRRNAAWTRWLAARMERPGTLLFAVGAMHLAGPDSVQAMLASRGITVRRIQ
jgi:uncharacterized protein YbaP (TraB family)